jgi:hypothetical protein
MLALCRSSQQIVVANVDCITHNGFLINSWVDSDAGVKTQ